MKTEIRLTTIADFDQVGKIFTEENQFHVELVPEIIQIANPIMTHDWFEKVLNNPDETLFAATIKESIVGVALVELRTNIDDPIFRPRKYLHVSEIAVAESHRGQGIGRLLMDRIHQWSREQDISEIELQVWERNDPAIGFYEKLGYQPWRRTMRKTISDRKK
jgi:ribosomal protein S18 acetylase RimI-like enzyme